MVDFEGLPAWARRRLARRFERGGSERILRWMSIPLGRGVATPGEEADAGTPVRDNVVAFIKRPEPVASYEPSRAVAVG